jgi:zinc transport system ATP-binding protein
MNNSTQPQAHCHEPVVTLAGVSFSYEGKQVIRDLNFNVLQRDFVGLAGSNGAGKTTLLRIIVGLLKPEQGEVRLFGEPYSSFRGWNRIGYVPQKNAFNPLFPATVREVVLSGLYGRNKLFKRLTAADTRKCEDALEIMNIADLADRRIGQLSGGQQQRAFLARALINNPELLILDEPTAGIDAETQEGFFELIRHMHQHHAITFLMVSHDIDMLEDYMGGGPEQVCGKLKFYVRHTHEPQNCSETRLHASGGTKREKIEVRG